MDEHRIEDALRAGPPDERPHRAGALARGLAARDSQPAEGSTFRVTLRDQSPRLSTFLIVAVVVFVVLSLVVAVVGTSPRRTPVPTLGTPSATASNASPDEPRSGLRRTGPAGGSMGRPGTNDPDRRRARNARGRRHPRGRPPVRRGSGQPRTLFASSVTQAAPDVLRLTALSPNLGCRPFDEGTYRWALSPGGTTMTLTALADACTARLAALPGTWTHTACREAAQDCLGPLEAGTYRSTEFDGTLAGSTGQLSYTVADGWANTSDHAINYALRPATDYANDPGFDGNDTVSGVYVWAGTLAADQPPDCSAVPANGVATTADAIADHIAHLDGLDVVDRGSTIISGRAARVLDVALDPAYTRPCPWSGGSAFRSLILFADAGADGGVQGLASGERARIVFVDVAPGRVSSIWIDGPAERFDTLVRDATPIVETFQFEGPSSAP